MKLEKICVSTVKEVEDKQTYFDLIIAAIEEIPACANQALYHPTIIGELWELSAYEDIGYRYSIILTPITNGEDTAEEWKMFFEYINCYSEGVTRFYELDFWGEKGISFKSFKSLNEIYSSYPWTKGQKSKK